MAITRVGRLLPGLGVALVVLAAGLLVATQKMWSYDAGIMAQVARSMVHNHNFVVTYDPFNINKPYASYGIGMSLLMVPGELLAPVVGKTTANLHALINPVLLVLIAVAVWLFARSYGAAGRQPAAIALIVVLATPLLPYAATTFTEPAVALGVAMGLLGVVLVRHRPYQAAVLAGAGAGLAILMRMDSLILVAPVVGVAVLFAARRRVPAMLGFGTGVLPAVAVVIGYNTARFGSPLVYQYQGMSADRAFGHPFLAGLSGLLVSPGRGLLLYAPVAILVAVAGRWAWRRSPVLTAACLAMLVTRLLFYAPWYAWHGGVGWGPRFLVPIMPALVPFIVECVRRLPSARLVARSAFAALVAVSFAVQVVGATTAPDKDALMDAIHVQEATLPRDVPVLDRLTTPAGMAAWDRALQDWSVFPVLDHAGRLVRGEKLTGRYLIPRPHPAPLAVLALLMLAGLTLTLLPVRERQRTKPGDGDPDRRQLPGPRRANHDDVKPRAPLPAVQAS